jgi:hypothetical protein
MLIYNILLYLILTILIIFYGGNNKLSKIKYNSNKFNYIKNLNIFKEKLIKYKNTMKTDYIDITKDINTCNYLLPNIVYSYCIKIESKNIFDVNYLIINDKYKDNYETIMNIYSINDDYKNLYIIIDKINNEDIMVELDENIYITNTYNIYNDNDNDVYLIIFFTKKPLWY